MSAGLTVDLGNSCQMGVSIVGTPILSGALTAPNSGAIVGTGINMQHADTYCNLFAAGYSVSGNQFRVQVQCADTDTSGSYTDPTSGLASMPGAFSSGGILWFSSGNNGGFFNPFTSGQATASGFMAAQGFGRTGTFVRALLLSGDAGGGPLTVGFISNFRTTGSGGGFTLAPSSGVVNV